MDKQFKEISVIKENTNENLGTIYDVSIKFFNIAIKELKQVTKLKINENTIDRLLSNLKSIPCKPPFINIKYVPKYELDEKTYTLIKFTDSERLIAFFAQIIFTLKYDNHGATRCYITKGNVLDKVFAKTSIKLDFTDLRLFCSYIVLKYSDKKDYNVEFIHGRLTDNEKKLIGCQEYPSCFIRKEAN
jgi:hypothetical protein